MCKRPCVCVQVRGQFGGGVPEMSAQPVCGMFVRSVLVMMKSHNQNQPGKERVFISFALQISVHHERQSEQDHRGRP